MDRKALQQIFAIEALEEFDDFEHFSTLIEDAEQVDEDMFYEVLDGVPADTLISLVACYFEDIKQGVPDDCMDIYGALSSVSVNFCNRLKQSSSHTEKMQFADELYRFRLWYMQEKQVACRDLATGSAERISVCEAFVRCRMEKLHEGRFEYDFMRVEPFVTAEYLDHEDDWDEEDDEDEYE